jgi:phospholipase/carboxylesterase
LVKQHGKRDPIIPREQTEQLAAMLASGGANTSVFWYGGGHELDIDDTSAARTWLTEIVAKRLAA